MKASELLLLPENLYYAWLKAKNLYRSADGYIDNGELAEFELDLERRLMSIHRQFERGNYRLNKLRPLPRPKKINKDGVPIDRQYYHVTVDDQVAWIAVANVLGPKLDKCSPPWNYGNRIYQPAWYEKGEDQKSVLEKGPYRHASGHLYRKFQHSWPLFRRHVALTARTMAKARSLSPDELDDADRLASATAEKENLGYLNGKFWKRPTDASTTGDLYHASIDLKEFYPSLKKTSILQGLDLAGVSDDPQMKTLLAGMLDFRIDPSDMPEETMKCFKSAFNHSRVRGLPTGLFVAGFLANAAMLPIDKIVDQRIRERRSLAHFRFVDDHTILAYSFDELCDWIEWYRSLLAEHGTGASINPEKYDPVSLSEWMRVRPKPSSSKRHEAKKETAVHDTRIDGANSAKLLTKTLAQVSAIAATNIDILDDDDLQERLKQLEWLLLADIPEREIRPDTRAAFAAGQIAILAPNLVQEADGLIDAARELAALNANAPNSQRSTNADIEKYQVLVSNLSARVKELQDDHQKAEDGHLRHCFGLLLQAFREFPGKARLFYRLHEYCRVTGFEGLNEIAEWIKEARERGHGVWADYYAGLSLQILARGMLLAARTLYADDALRSDSEASVRHLKHVGQLEDQVFLMPRHKEAWFHAVGRKEFGVALLSTAETVEMVLADKILGARLRDLARKCVGVSFDQVAANWELETAYRPSVWAHLSESVLGTERNPSPIWQRFEPSFSLAHTNDLHAARRYPEHLSDRNWTELLNLSDPLPETDSGWLREVMGAHKERVEAAKSSRRVAFTRAARSLEAPADDWITLAQWTKQIGFECSPFDPRRSEWTALEMVRQIVFQSKGLTSQFPLDRLHPANVLVPISWTTEFPVRQGLTELSWEKWRNFLKERSSKDDKQIKLRESATSVLDYRYFLDLTPGEEWEQQLSGIGRLLLGVLRRDHSAPRIWNIRGNERVFALPRARWFQALAISSPTLLIVEGCLGGRSAETRAISREPGLFGWTEGVKANDAAFDPPMLHDPDALLDSIKRAQTVLEENQLAVALNQPRQLIPFRLIDFAAGPDAVAEEADIG